jgi:hypothetical protein
MSDLQASVSLLALGAFHGINPGMGWLFAVALGLQERRCRAVVESLVPIALGHALSIGAVVLVVAIIHTVAPVAWVRWSAGAGLIAFGAHKLFRSRHPRWVGMRVGFRDLVAWSFLMASAHGAGLMLVPVILGWAGDATAGPEHRAGGHAGHAPDLAAVGATPAVALWAAAVHTFGYLAVMGITAVVVYEKVGLSILRKAWFNLELIWCLALVVTGVVTLLV